MTSIASAHPPPQLVAGIWRVADPRITLASVASMILGAGAASRSGPIHWGWLALTVLGIFCVEAAKNASGEIFDWDSGTDRALTPAERSPFSGGKRLIVDGLLDRRQTAWLAGAFYAAAAVIGIVVAAFREPRVLGLAVVGVGLAWFYHAPPLQLSYRGWGELAVALCYGPGIAAGTYLVQRGRVGADVVLASLPLGLAIASFLWINEFPDARADALAGKRTLVVRLGRPAAARAYLLVVVGTYLALLLLPAAGLPLAVWAGGIGVVPALAAARRLLRSYDVPAELIPAQAWTLISFVLLAGGVGAGLAWG